MKKISVALLKDVLIDALARRQTRYVLIDEAQHITKVKSQLTAEDQTDTLKEISSLSGTKIILFGTPQLEILMDLNGQLSRRGHLITLNRYDIHNEESFKYFVRVLKSFQKKFPIKNEVDLISSAEFFYKSTVGCIGILKTLLIRTLRYELNHNPHTEEISIDRFRVHQMDYKRIENIYLEVMDFEKKQQERTKDDEKLDNLFGLKPPEKKNKQNKKSNKKPGQRKPTRDKVYKEGNM